MPTKYVKRILRVHQKELSLVRACFHDGMYHPEFEIKKKKKKKEIE
jgi:hypothetical protein